MCTRDELLPDGELILFSPAGKKYGNEIDIIFIVCLFIVYFLYSGGDISSPGIIDVVKYINTTGTAFCYFSPPFLFGELRTNFERKKFVLNWTLHYLKQVSTKIWRGKKSVLCNI